MRRLCAIPQDLSQLQCDAWGVKKLFAYGCRRAGFDKSLSKSPKRRESQLKRVFQVVVSLSCLRLIPSSWIYKLFIFNFHGSSLLFPNQNALLPRGQEIGVNDFYVEIFKYWTLKKPRKALSTTPAATSTSSASSTSGVEVVDLADSGDESGDLSVIMEVRDKSDPYTTIFEDSDQDCAEAAALSDEIRDYATSTMAILNDAISDAMDEEAADEIRLSPEYPGEDPYPAVEEPVTVNPKEPVPDPDMGGPVAASSSMATPADQPGVPPPAAPTRENKTFTDTQGVMTIKDVEQKILYLKCLGFKWVKLQMVLC